MPSATREADHDAAAESAAHLMESIHGMERVFAENDISAREIAAFGDRVVAGEPAPPMPGFRAAERAMPEDEFELLGYALGLVKIRRLWSRYRIAYDLDPDLLDELGDTADGDMIPREVLLRLPHPDPFVAFPDPLVLYGQGHYREKVPGMFVSGFRSATWTEDVGPGERQDFTGELPCSTMDPRCEGLTLAIPRQVLYDGKPRIDVAHDGTRFQQVAWTVVPFRFTGDMISFADLVTEIQSRMEGEDCDCGLDHESNQVQMLRRAVATLLYLCSDNNDVVRVTRRSRRSRDPRNSRTKTTTVYAVGHRIGAALRRYRIERERAAGSTPTGWTVPPHLRRSHFHTFRRGPGHMERFIKWLPPIPVNIDGDQTFTTVIPVNAERAQ